MTYSVQLWSVRADFATDPTGTLRRLRAAGFTAVEPFDIFDLAENHAATLSQLGLSVPSAHVPLLERTDLSEVIAAAATLGTHTLIDSGRREGWDDPAAISDYAQQLNAHAHEAAARGLQVGYHNHWWELGTSEETALERFAGQLDPAVVLEVDIYWAAVGGADVSALLKRLGTRVALMHVKDGAVMPNPPSQSQVPVGSGKVSISEALDAAPHALRVLEFDDYAGDVFHALKIGLGVVIALDGRR